MQLPANDDVIHLQGDRDLNNANYLLTGDGNVVSLDATVFFTITDPTVYLLAEDHVRPALNRLYLASAVTLAASRSLDDFLVARPDQDRASPVGAVPPKHAAEAARPWRHAARPCAAIWWRPSTAVFRRCGGRGWISASPSGASMWSPCCRRWRRPRSTRC